MEGSDAMSTSARPDSRLTYDDFLLFPDDGQRHELIDGEHYVTPTPVLRHQRLLGRLHLAVADYLRGHPGHGEVLLSPFGIVFSKWDVVEPDLMFIARDQPHILTEKNIVGAPALVVEILSPSTRRRDQTLKLRLFEKHGVREYWMVDPDHDTVTVDRLDENGAFTRFGVLGVEAALSTPLLPGWTLPLGQLFA
ncbi:MAG: Uma2 family endonuclease [Acidobacteriota bacterium]|nr:Uma2 family endonuclease [Acidobacteriota bacterium]